MQKVVAILTISERYLLSNPGSFLQHWALRNVYRSMGLNPIRVPNDDDLNATDKGNRIIAAFVQVIRVCLHYIGVKKYRSNSYGFRSLFESHRIKRFKQAYHHFIGPLYENGTYYDIVSVGGDQVFYPDHLKVALSLASRKHIVYAASADWSIAQKSADWVDRMQDYLIRFDAIGIRENKGIKILGDRVSNVIRVADPVMLLDPKAYNVFLSKKGQKQRNSLFVYLLNIKSSEMMPVEELEELANALNVDIRMTGIQGAENFIPVKYYAATTPSSFVDNISKSKYVITNSYHATLLAVMFHKPFISLRQFSSQNTRQQELLSYLGLQDHRISNEELSILGESLLNEKVDWMQVDQMIACLKNDSLDWLKQAIQ